MMKKLLLKVRHRIMKYKMQHLNIVETLIINFLYLPFGQARHLPIYVYNDTSIINLKKIVIDGEIKRGMIKIGVHPQKAHGRTKIIGGSFIFHGEAQLWGGCMFENSATIELGDKVAFAENCVVMCKERITLGEFVHFGFNCILMDTDFHYIVDIKNEEVSRNTIPIEIRKGTWVSSNVTMMKGAGIPENSVVANGALVNKNYLQAEPNSIFVGVPAKQVKTGFRRLYNVVAERAMDDCFEEKPDTDKLKIPKDERLDDYCYSYCLNFYEINKGERNTYGKV